MEKYRLQKFISDISGVDIKAHHKNSEEVIQSVRDWLKVTSGRVTIPSYQSISEEHQDFKTLRLAIMPVRSNMELDELTYIGFCNYIEIALKTKLKQE